jgi:nickel-dependent lactate racemase
MLVTSMDEAAMGKISFGLAYGREQLPVDVPGKNLLGVYLPSEMVDVVDEERILEQALANPIGTRPLRKIVRKGDRIAIITSDVSRPCPSGRLLPHILAELEDAGIPDEADEDVFIVFALGIHRQMTPGEISSALTPEILERFRVLNHDPENVVRLGVTSAGTPVEIFKPVVEADVRICLGDLAFHYFAGYSGGAKAIVPGCASRASVAANHAMMVRPEAAAGRLDGNPLRMDLEEAVGMLGVDFIYNVLVDEEHRIVGAVAGDLTAAHRAGCEMVAARGMVHIPRQADIVLASAGGFPKDLDFVQGHKALESAKYFVRDGGIIILASKCSDGIGNKVFESWLLDSRSPDEIIEHIQREFVLGGHMAAALALILKRAAIYLISDIPDEHVRQAGMQPFRDPRSSLLAAFAELGDDSQVIVLPQAASIFPKIEA